MHLSVLLDEESFGIVLMFACTTPVVVADAVAFGSVGFLVQSNLVFPLATCNFLVPNRIELLEKFLSLIFKTYPSSDILASSS